MGLNGSKEKKAQSKVNEEPPRQKWILLGGGEMGKTTLMKNIISFYGTNLLARPDWLTTLREDTWQSMQLLVNEAERVYSQRLGGSIAENLHEEKKIIQSYDPYSQICEKYTMEVGAAIHRLWQDPFIRQCYTLGHEFQLPDSAGYWFDRALLWSDPNYTFTLLDVLHSYRRTSGIEEANLTINGDLVTIVDTGGQKNERKKWIHVFDNTPSVLFVVAISHYNQMMFEDPRCNRLADSLAIFDELIKAQYFTQSRFVLVFNKMDVFRERIQIYPLRDYFPDYDGPQQDADAAQAWLVQQFRNRLPSHRQIDDIFFTTATDLVDTQSNVSNMYARLLSLHQSQQ
eukprot:TRINITY_DN3258_c0_g1_i2.p1 TRINITY_DN3258_c0_g1~~TRINITY_DN3258_c0_g1_i2.p1  ORF type:complete len:361 (+),score=35.61 TRINITY_DN3258_c0_g1_i2:56-1084(+)